MSGSQCSARRTRLVRLAISLLAFGCGGTAESVSSSTGQSTPSGDESAECAPRVSAPAPLPNVSAEQRTLSYWLERQATYGALDEVLVPSPEAHVAGLREREDLLQAGLEAPIDPATLRSQLEERLSYMRERAQNGTTLERDGSRSEDLSAFALRDYSLAPSLHVATDLVPVRCAPRTEGLYTESLDLDFDRNLCFTLHTQEPVEVLADWPGTSMRLVRSAYGLGFIAADAALSAEADELGRQTLLHGARSILREDGAAAGVSLPAGTVVAITEEGAALIGGADGFEQVELSGLATLPALTRQTFFEEAFSLLDTPYGWGGREGGRDCSRFVLDVFARFGVTLPRHSAVQARSGTYQIDVEAMSPSEKKLTLEAAARSGIVLMHFPGHIMIYLGTSADGAPMAIHSFSEYLSACTNGGETVHRVDRVDVSDLTLGEGSSRTDFLSRITRLSVFGPEAGALAGAAEERAVATPPLPAGECEDDLDHAIFRSPWRPNPTQPLRVIATMSDDPGPVTVALYDAQGELVDGQLHRIGGPPFTAWFEVAAPRPGRYTAVVGDGPRQIACERFTVARAPPRPEPRPYVEGGTPAWDATWTWERDTENFYSAFVEQLFLEPGDEDPTWSNLQELLREPSRNLLFDHRHLDEDTSLDLEPDCADLPYFLRAYFAWKVRLPFAWRQCRRGRDGRPPACEETPADQTTPIEANSELEAFRRVMRVIARNVHSSSNRTVPQDEHSDVYPVPLTRDALRPGTIYADPYGHILVLAGWRPQTLDDYGVLVAADAQPDGTVGRRRFWRGSFLFDPDTTSAGPGFKAWRPVHFDRGEGATTLMSNAELRDTDEFAPFSMQQYEGNQDDFYDRVEALINPRPLPAASVLGALVDALHESVERRVLSVDNGEEWVQQHRVMEMPEGASIFQTEGPWEDFATPSRDMRLLISLDAVTGFPDVVRRNPARFGLDASEVDEAASALETSMAALLAERSIQYRRSDGQTQTLTLAQIVARAEAFEMAYNPNDCIEIRWGASEGDADYASCRRHAPAGQRRQMANHRGWFETRQRPAR